MLLMKFTNKEFLETRLRTEELYSTFNDVKVPYLNTEVAFNTKGLDHIKLRKWNKARSHEDQYMRLKLIYLAPQILKLSRTLQGIEKGKKFERLKVNGRWEHLLVTVTYYEFIAVIDKCRAKIIVKQINDEKPYFWSIVPFWKVSNRGKKMFEGDPEDD